MMTTFDRIAGRGCRIWPFVAFMAVASLLGILASAPARSDFTTAEVAGATLSVDCVDWRIKGVCLRLKCGFFGCRVISVPWVEHRLPDLVVSSYNNPFEPPWTELRTLGRPLKTAADALGQSVLGSVIDGGHGTDKKRSEGRRSTGNLRFKEVSVIGNPAVRVFRKRASEAFPVFCPTEVDPLQPYFQSELDLAAWRTGLTEQLYPETWNPLARPIGPPGRADGPGQRIPGFRVELLGQASAPRCEIELRLEVRLQRIHLGRTEHREGFACPLPEHPDSRIADDGHFLEAQVSSRPASLAAFLVRAVTAIDDGTEHGLAEGIGGGLQGPPKGPELRPGWLEGIVVARNDKIRKAVLDPRYRDHPAAEESALQAQADALDAPVDAVDGEGGPGDFGGGEVGARGGGCEDAQEAGHRHESNERPNSASSPGYSIKCRHHALA